MLSWHHPYQVSARSQKRIELQRQDNMEPRSHYCTNQKEGDHQPQ